MNYISPELGPGSKAPDIDIIEAARTAIKDVINGSKSEVLVEIGRFARKVTTETVCIQGLVDRASGLLLAVQGNNDDSSMAELPVNAVPVQLDIGLESENFAIRGVRGEELNPSALSGILGFAAQINDREGSI